MSSPAQGPRRAARSRSYERSTFPSSHSCSVVHNIYPNYLLWLTSQDNHVEIDIIACSIHVFFFDDSCDVLLDQLDQQWGSAAYLEK